MTSPLLPRSAVVNLVEGASDASAPLYVTVRLSDGTNFYNASGGSGGLTDAQLRASPVPISGTVAVTAAALPLPSGAATDAGLVAIYARLNDGSQHVVVDSGTLAVTGTFFQATQPVSAASLPLPTGAATETTLGLVATQATLALIKAKTDNLDVALSTRAITGLTDTQLRATPVPVSGTFWQATQPVSGTFWQATQPVSGTFWQATQPVSGTFWQATQPVSIAATVAVAATCSTGALSSVAGANVDTLILAANASRRGATIFNDSTADLKLGLSTTTVTASVFSVTVAGGGYYEVPFGYTGQIRGIWATTTGNARLTELT